jgi:hypothetical protein
VPDFSPIHHPVPIKRKEEIRDRKYNRDGRKKETKGKIR